jgi:multiple antibiotic resistance protein
MHKRNDIALTPLAIPCLLDQDLSLLIAFYSEHQETSEIIISVLYDSSCYRHFIILRSAHYLAKLLGASGIVAISRIVGFYCYAIGVQYIISSILTIVKQI